MFLDSSATRGVCRRVRCERQNHVQVRFLWLQEAAADERVEVRRLDTSFNTSLRLGCQVPGQAQEGGIDLKDAVDAVQRARQSGGSSTGALCCPACTCGEQGSREFRPSEGRM